MAHHTAPGEPGCLSQLRLPRQLEVPEALEEEAAADEEVHRGAKGLAAGGDQRARHEASEDHRRHGLQRHLHGQNLGDQSELLHNEGQDVNASEHSLESHLLTKAPTFKGKS